MVNVSISPKRSPLRLRRPHHRASWRFIYHESRAHPALTFSTVEAAHTDLIERLAVLRPYRILYIADARELGERAQHLQQVLGAILDYVGAIVADTSQVAPGGSIDRKYLLGLISDLAGDVAGSIANAADDLAAEGVW
jgi:hypothetical protein